MLVFYILTIVGLFVLRRTHPDAERPYRAIGYPVLPAIYIVMALFIDVVLLRYKPQYTWPGLIIVLLGIPVYYMWRRRKQKLKASHKIPRRNLRMANLLATKPLDMILSESREEGEHSLKRALGATNLITLGIGAIIGAGIFVLTGAAAANYAGPAIVLAFILSAIACLFAGLCYSEFAALIPIAGSAYTYGYATLGEIFAWIIGWDLILEYAFGAATVASGWSGYVISFLNDFGIHIPPSLTGTPGTAWSLQPGYDWQHLANPGPWSRPATLRTITARSTWLLFLPSSPLPRSLLSGSKSLQILTQRS